MKYALLHVWHGSDWKHRPNIGATTLAVGDDKEALEQQADEEAQKGLEGAIDEQKKLYDEEVDNSKPDDVALDPFDPNDCGVSLLKRPSWEVPHINYSETCGEGSFSSYIVVELPQ